MKLNGGIDKRGLKDNENSYVNIQNKQVWPKWYFEKN